MIRLNRYFLPRDQAMGFGPTLESWSPEDHNHFLSDFVTPQALLNHGKERAETFDTAQRTHLYETLLQQYQQSGSLIPNTLERIKLANVVTITTGHQLSLALGPLFFIYKVLHVIQLCDTLNKENHDVEFVPVFWLASEDHDLEEIQSVHFYNKTFQWLPDELGSVGVMNTNKLSACYEEILALFDNETATELKELFQVNSNLYGQHYHQLLSKIFGQYGLILIDGNDSELKQLFVPLMKKEIEEQFIHSQVSKTNIDLLKAGKPTQAHVRPINLFYLGVNSRDRIVSEGQEYRAGENLWSKVEILAAIESNPERFSPNVLMRPLYQETILPNVCYVGGTGELNYWAQLKSGFQIAGLPFPLLLTRISGFILKSGPWEDVKQAFRPLKEQIDALYLKETNREPFFNTLDEKLNALIQVLSDGALPFGTEGEKWSQAQIKTIEAALSHYKTRWQKQEKLKLESSMNRINKKHEEIYPNNKAQERYTSILHFCEKNSLIAFIDQIKGQIDPFTEDLHIFVQSHETE